MLSNELSNWLMPISSQFSIFRIFILCSILNLEVQSRANPQYPFYVLDPGFTSAKPQLSPSENVLTQPSQLAYNSGFQSSNPFENSYSEYRPPEQFQQFHAWSASPSPAYPNYLIQPGSPSPPLSNHNPNNGANSNSRPNLISFSKATTLVPRLQKSEQSGVQLINFIKARPLDMYRIQQFLKSLVLDVQQKSKPGEYGAPTRPAPSIFSNQGMQQSIQPQQYAPQFNSPPISQLPGSELNIQIDKPVRSQSFSFDKLSTQRAPVVEINTHEWPSRLRPQSSLSTMLSRDSNFNNPQGPTPTFNNAQVAQQNFETPPRSDSFDQNPESKINNVPRPRPTPNFNNLQGPTPTFSTGQVPQQNFETPPRSESFVQNPEPKINNTPRPRPTPNFNNAQEPPLAPPNFNTSPRPEGYSSPTREAYQTRINCGRPESNNCQAQRFEPNFSSIPRPEQQYFNPTPSTQPIVNNIQQHEQQFNSAPPQRPDENLNVNPRPQEIFRIAEGSNQINNVPNTDQKPSRIPGRVQIFNIIRPSSVPEVRTSQIPDSPNMAKKSEQMAKEEPVEVTVIPMVPRTMYTPGKKPDPFNKNAVLIRQQPLDISGVLRPDLLRVNTVRPDSTKTNAVLKAEPFNKAAVLNPELLNVKTLPKPATLPTRTNVIVKQEPLKVSTVFRSEPVKSTPVTKPKPKQPKPKLPIQYIVDRNTQPRRNLQAPQIERPQNELEPPIPQDLSTLPHPESESQLQLPVKEAIDKDLTNSIKQMMTGILSMIIPVRLDTSKITSNPESSKSSPLQSRFPEVSTTNAPIPSPVTDTICDFRLMRYGLNPENCKDNVLPKVESRDGSDTTSRVDANTRTPDLTEKPAKTEAPILSPLPQISFPTETICDVRLVRDGLNPENCTEGVPANIDPRGTDSRVNSRPESSTGNKIQDPVYDVYLEPRETNPDNSIEKVTPEEEGTSQGTPGNTPELNPDISTTPNFLTLPDTASTTPSEQTEQIAFRSFSEAGTSTVPVISGTPPSPVQTQAVNPQDTRSVQVTLPHSSTAIIFVQSGIPGHATGRFTLIQPETGKIIGEVSASQSPKDDSEGFLVPPEINAGFIGGFNPEMSTSPMKEVPRVTTPMSSDVGKNIPQGPSGITFVPPFSTIPQFTFQSPGPSTGQKVMQLDCLIQPAGLSRIPCATLISTPTSRPPPQNSRMDPTNQRSRIPGVISRVQDENPKKSPQNSPGTAIPTQPPTQPPTQTRTTPSNEPEKTTRIQQISCQVSATGQKIPCAQLVSSTSAPKTESTIGRNTDSTELPTTTGAGFTNPFGPLININFVMPPGRGMTTSPGLTGTTLSGNTMMTTIPEDKTSTFPGVVFDEEFKSGSTSENPPATTVILMKEMTKPTPSSSGVTTVTSTVRPIDCLINDGSTRIPCATLETIPTLKVVNAFT